MRRRALVDRAWGVAAFLMVMAAGGSVMAQPIRLSITGDPGASVQGSCSLTGSADGTVIEIDGPVPIEHRLDGTSVTCDLKARGHVAVEIVRGNSRSRSVTSGGRVHVSVR